MILARAIVWHIMAYRFVFWYHMRMSTVFKKIIDGEIPADIVYEDEYTLAFLDINPAKKGHTLVIPKIEFENIFDADPEYLGHMMRTAQKVAHALKKAVGAKGVNIAMNNGAEASQDVFHAHIHVIPRFERGEIFPPPPHETYTDGESAELAEKIKLALS